MNTRLVLYYAPPGARSPLPVAVIHEPGMIQAAAESAIGEAEREATSLTRVDAELGREAQLEADKLRKLLLVLIPTLGSETVRSSCTA